MSNYSLNHALNLKTNPVELTFAKTLGTDTEDREKFEKIGQQLTSASSVTIPEVLAKANSSQFPSRRF